MPPVVWLSLERRWQALRRGGVGLHDGFHVSVTVFHVIVKVTVELKGGS